MTSKERILKALNGEKTDVNPVAIHGWGMYKFWLAGKIKADHSEEAKAWELTGEDVVNVEMNLYNTLRPDWMHLCEAHFEDIKERINAPQNSELLNEVRMLESKTAIDQFLDIIYLNLDQFINSKKFDHVKILNERLGDKVFIALNTEGPIHDICDPHGVLGFENAMIAMLDKPDMFLYLSESMHEKQLNFVRALKAMGCHGYIQSDSYFTPNLVSPELYLKLFYNTQKEFYKKVEEIGLAPILLFWGNVGPLVKYINDFRIRGLMVEESRKNYTLDVGEIRKVLKPDIGIFGNVSGESTLLHGTPDDVRKEVRLQLEKAGKNGGFITCNGTPFAFGTPVENIKAMIDEARK